MKERARQQEIDRRPTGEASGVIGAVTAGVVVGAEAEAGVAARVVQLAPVVVRGSDAAAADSTHAPPLARTVAVHL